MIECSGIANFYQALSRDMMVKILLEIVAFFRRRWLEKK
jgi:hypothetical protein